MSQYKKSKKKSTNQTKNDNDTTDNTPKKKIIEEKKGQSVSEDNDTDGRTIEDIFSYENPTAKDIMIILREIFSSVQFLASKYDEILKRNLELENLCTDLKTENKTLREEIQVLKEDVDNIENTHNEKKIEVHGLPYKKNEDLCNIITKIGKTFDFNIEKEDIDDAYRIERVNNKDDKIKPVVVSFVRKRDKEKFLNMRRKRSLFSNEIGLDEIRTQIFINEYLSRRKKQLLWKTRKFKLEKNYKFVWTKNGRILLRKTENSQIIQVHSQEDLEKLE